MFDPQQGHIISETNSADTPNKLLNLPKAVAHRVCRELGWWSAAYRHVYIQFVACHIGEPTIASTSGCSHPPTLYQTKIAVINENNSRKHVNLCWWRNRKTMLLVTLVCAGSATFYSVYLLSSWWFSRRGQGPSWSVLVFLKMIIVSYNGNQ